MNFEGFKGSPQRPGKAIVPSPASNIFAPPEPARPGTAGRHNVCCIRSTAPDLALLVERRGKFTHEHAWQASSISFGDSDQYRQEAYKAHAKSEAKTFEPQVQPFECSFRRIWPLTSCYAAVCSTSRGFE